MADRSFPEQRPHEATFRGLTPPAKLCWYTLTGTLGASGIAISYPDTLAALTGHTTPEVTTALDELEAAGWLRRQGSVMWLVRGLEEQGLNPRNANHRASVQSHLSSLEPLAPELVAAFRAHYQRWLEPFQETGAPPGDPPTTPMPSGDHADGIRMVSRAKEGRRKGGKEGGSSSSSERAPQSESGDLDQARGRRSPAAQAERNRGRATAAATAPRSASSTAAPPASRRSPLPGPALRLLRECYGWRDGETPTERQRAVGKQLRETLAGGVKYEGAPVRAVDEAHLAWACGAVLDEPPKKRDIAIQWVLLKLRDTYTERLAAQERAAAAAAEREGESRTALALSWCAAHGGDAYRGELAQLAIELGLQEATAAEMELNPIWRTARNAAAVRFWKQHGSPAMPDDGPAPAESERAPPPEPAAEPAAEETAEETAADTAEELAAVS